MKHQYFADVTDYKKYSLLRFVNKQIAGDILTAWLLTPDDQSNDGRHVGYLSNPDAFKKYEPDIFDSLSRHHANGNRSVSVVTEEGYVPGMNSFDHIIPDSAQGRREYMSALQEEIEGYSVLFFDPDNGMEVKSVQYGKPKSSKYLYWHELRDFYRLGVSVLVYQHFARVKREPFMQAHAQRMLQETEAPLVASVETSWVGFFLVLQPKHLRMIEPTWHNLQNKWGEEHMRTRLHSRS